MPFWKRDQSIQEKINHYFDEMDQLFAYFEKAFRNYLDNGPGPTFEALVDKTHEGESSADDRRRDIELQLYGKALLPDSRGDILGLLETYDQLGTAAERVLFDLTCQSLRVPEAIKKQFATLVDLNLEAYYLLRKTVDALFNNPRTTLHSVKEVDGKESESDRAERALVKAVWAQEMDKADKLELRNLIERIGSISDLAEHIADRIGIIAIKRQI